jgi:hypothetical protein
MYISINLDLASQQDPVSSLTVPDDDELRIQTSNRRMATTRTKVLHSNKDNRPAALLDKTNYVTEHDDSSNDEDEGGNYGQELMPADDSLFYRRLSSAV